MGSAGLELTDEQYDIMQSLVDEAYDQFVEIVCNGRNMDDANLINKTVITCLFC